MLEAVQKATTLERLDSIQQSCIKGLNTKKLSEDRGERIEAAIQTKRRELQSASQSKAA